METKEKTLFFVLSSISPDNIVRLFPHDESIKWIYCGRNYMRMKSIESALGERFHRIDIASHLNRLADEIRKEFIEWMDDLNRNNSHTFMWWLGNLSSRNVYSSNLFLYSCYIELITSLYDNNENTPSLIITESYALAQVLIQWANNRAILFKAVTAPFEHTLKRILWWRDTLLRWLGSSFRIFSRYCAALFSISSRKELPEHPIIIDTFVSDSYISKDGTFTDKFFPYLHQYLADQGEKVLIHPVLVNVGFNYFTIIKNLRNGSSHFLIQEDYLTVFDYLEALCYPIYIFLRKVKSRDFRGNKLDPLFSEEESGGSIASGIQAYLMYRLFYRLKKKINPKLLIDWYENQIIDRAVIGGFTHSYPEKKTIGAQIFISSENDINLFPSKSEIESQVAPYMIVTAGEYQSSIIKKYVADIPCSITASLRYLHVFDDVNNKNPVKDDLFTLLVILPQNMDYSLEILDSLTNCLPEIKQDIRILVKNHPTVSPERIIRAFGNSRWDKKYIFFTDTIANALKRTNVALSSNSSAIIEALALGVPTICYVQQSQLYHDLLSRINAPHAFLCYSHMELKEQITELLSISEEKIASFKIHGKELRDYYFTPISSEILAPFLLPLKGG
ncbi:MAG: hypothetical protein AB2L14_31650 [Candidatus Xenobiia bacterium LiM19]